MIQSRTLLLLLLLSVSLGCGGIDQRKVDGRSNNDDKKGDRVAQATAEKQVHLATMLAEIGVEWETPIIYLRAFKQEKALEVWARNNGEQGFKLLVTYPFCTSSGDLGPKRKEGDYQIPEGLYYIDRFNPKSNYHLSMGIDYPNKSDQKRGFAARLGGDIFIHGKCVTIGCIPITDDKIKELYILAEQAKNRGQKNIRADIFPARMTNDKLVDLQNQYTKHTSFWKELQPFYAYFEEHQEVPRFRINSTGAYELR